jgi:ABC-type cobalamin transport system permease subunit
MWQCYNQDAFWMLLWSCAIMGAVFMAAVLYVFDRRRSHE